MQKLRRRNVAGFVEEISAGGDGFYHSDWKALQRHLSVLPVRERSVPFYRQWLKYAAVIVLMMMTAGTTYWATDRFKPVSCGNGTGIRPLRRK